FAGKRAQGSCRAMCTGAGLEMEWLRPRTAGLGDHVQARRGPRRVGHRDSLNAGRPSGARRQSMFIQLIQAKVRDEAGLRRCMDRWTEELQPGATGYLGHTCGMSDNDIWVCLARFESAEAARRNSERPEQDRWWAETRQCF